MDEGIEVVAFACRGTLVDWTGAIDAVAYELARRNGESPLDRGAVLGRRVEALAGDHGLARGFERLALERGYRGEESGAELLARVVAMARPLRGAPEAVALAVRSGKRVAAVSRAESGAALRPYDGAFEAVVRDPRELDAAARRDPLREHRRVAARGGAPLRYARHRARVDSARRSPTLRVATDHTGRLMGGLAVKPISTTEAVVVSLRAGILDGVIEPGVRLPELELAAEFGVARPTVRAAIQTLCHEGLLVRERNRSAHIPVLTREEILDLFSVRIPLECLVVRAVLERGAPLDAGTRGDGGDGGPARRRRLERGRRRRRRIPPRARHARSARRAWSVCTARLSGEIRLCVAQLRPSWASPSAIGHEHHEVLDVLESGDVGPPRRG